MTLMIDDTADLWWKNAIFYCLDVETFLDGNGDGCGDFNGRQRVDYLAGLGVTCLWLMPFSPRPTATTAMTSLTIMPWTRLGTLADFVEFVRTARDRGLRVIADLVVNHTRASTHGSGRRAPAVNRCIAASMSGVTSRPRKVLRILFSPIRRTATGNGTRKLGSTFCTLPQAPA